jgi:hypothetical protein
MAGSSPGRKLHGSFTAKGQEGGCARLNGESLRLFDWEGHMAGLAMVLFFSLIAYGAEYFGWEDPKGYVQIALVACFICGTICGTKLRG